MPGSLVGDLCPRAGDECPSCRRPPTFEGVPLVHRSERHQDGLMARRLPVLSPIRDFLRTEAGGGVLLLAATTPALPPGGGMNQDQAVSTSETATA